MLDLYFKLMLKLALACDTLASKFAKEACLAVVKDNEMKKTKASKAVVETEATEATLAKPFPPTNTEDIPEFKGADDKPIPPAFDELPPYPIFQLMFIRKFGSKGYCPMVIGGQNKKFTCDTLYELLSQIRTQPDVTPMHLAVYGTVMAVVLHAHGEESADKLQLN